MPSLHPLVHLIRHVVDSGMLSRMSDEAAKLLLNFCKYTNADLQCFPGEERLMRETGKSRAAFYRAMDELRQIPGFCDRWQETGRRAWTQFHITEQPNTKQATTTTPSTLRHGVSVMRPQGSQKCDPRGLRSETLTNTIELIQLSSSSGDGKRLSSPAITAAAKELEKRGITEKKALQIAREWGPQKGPFRKVLGAFDKKREAHRNPGLLVHMFTEDAPEAMRKEQELQQIKTFEVTEATERAKKDKATANQVRDNNQQKISRWQALTRKQQEKSIQVAENTYPTAAQGNHKAWMKSVGNAPPGNLLALLKI